MSKYSKINFVYFMQKWMDSVPGQTFMNYAYSWGAAVVILGTLFKLTHLPGANAMLFVGMGTEVFVFFISAFDRPFDKTTIDMSLDNHMADEVIDQAIANPIGETQNIAVSQPAAVNAGQSAPVVVTPSVAVPQPAVDYQSAAQGATSYNETPAAVGTPVISGGTVIIGSGSVGQSGEEIADESVAGFGGAVSGGTVVMPRTVTPAPAVSQETAESMEEVTKAYIERLAELNVMLEKVGQLTSRLATDSEEMENLNRTLTGISRVYEMQLKSASQQITTQDEINDQTRRMADQIKELNAIYTRMIEAMTVNMPGNIRA